MNLNEQQRQFLLGDLQGFRVSQRAIGGGRKASYLEAYDVRRHLLRLFGFGNFDVRTLNVQCVVDQPGTRENSWTVAYLATVELLVRGASGMAVYSASAVGSSENQPSLAQAHDHALKTAESDALKRAAINLGTQFGLSLYQNGSLQDIVGRTLDVDQPADTVAEEPVVPEDQTPEQPTEAETSQDQDVPADESAAQGAVPVSQDWDGDLTAVLDRIRAIYSLPTAAQKVTTVAEMKATLPPAALTATFKDKNGSELTIERALDVAASDALRTPVAGNA
jgi:recombination DNA repair RAD52 pathway protein